MTSFTRATALCALIAMSLAGSGCFGGDDSGGTAATKGEVVITCEACPTTAPENDPFARYRKELTAAFNQEFKGRYRIDPKPYTPANDADSAQHYQRAATTDTLPDLFTDQATVVRDVARTGKLVDFAPILDAGGWKGAFQPDAFLSLTDDDGHVWGIPEQRDAVGIYYNKALFERAGLDAFPATWDELLSALLGAEGRRHDPVRHGRRLGHAADVVEPDRHESRRARVPPDGIKEGDYAANAEVVGATEYLRGSTPTAASTATRSRATTTAPPRRSSTARRR